MACTATRNDHLPTEKNGAIARKERSFDQIENFFVKLPKVSFHPILIHRVPATVRYFCASIRNTAKMPLLFYSPEEPEKKKRKFRCARLNPPFNLAFNPVMKRCHEEINFKAKTDYKKRFCVLTRLFLR